MTPEKVSDPHPSDEEHYDERPHPGGTHVPADDVSPNDRINNGKPQPQPEPRPLHRPLDEAPLS